MLKFTFGWTIPVSHLFQGNQQQHQTRLQTLPVTENILDVSISSHLKSFTWGTVFNNEIIRSTIFFSFHLTANVSFCRNLQGFANKGIRGRNFRNSKHKISLFPVFQPPRIRLTSPRASVNT